MGVFTALGGAELGELASELGLGHVREFRAIAAGTINSNFELVADTGRYFVRVNEGKAEADVAWEARLVTALAKAGVVTPSPMVASSTGLPYAPIASSGGRKWASVFPWRDGKHLAAEAVTAAHAERFGVVLAELHVAGLELPTAWRRGSIYDHDHLMMRFERCARVDDKALSRAVAILREELAVARGAMPVRRAATQGFIHGDLFRDNVLWNGEPEVISAILDFEQASGGSLVYDLAVCINDWCWTIFPRFDLAAALVAGYTRVRPLSAADRAALPIEVRAAAARFTLTRITDVYLARVDNPDKDFRAFLARCEAWRGPALGQLTAAV
ncbi:MAG TPA: homoserine kinase [Kofleriaceae bacterium]|nr:homoserine kinase [Kofleriaceae bacterium]